MKNGMRRPRRKQCSIPAYPEAPRSASPMLLDSRLVHCRKRYLQNKNCWISRSTGTVRHCRNTNIRKVDNNWRICNDNEAEEKKGKGKRLEDERWKTHFNNGKIDDTISLQSAGEISSSIDSAVLYIYDKYMPLILIVILIPFSAYGSISRQTSSSALL